MDPVLTLVNRSNQRGGRMLSVIDLLEADTLTRFQACWLLARIERGASWLVGGRPGGAGKTTIMSALLAMLPAGERVRLADHGTGWERSRPGDCVVAYEIGRGTYQGYIWGCDLARMAELGAQGCRIVTNLHADTLDEAREQIVAANRIPETRFQAFDLFLPIEIHGGFLNTRRIVPHIRYAENGVWQTIARGEHTLDPRHEAIGAFLDGCRQRGLVAVGGVRDAWLGWLTANPRPE